MSSNTPTAKAEQRAMKLDLEKQLEVGTKNRTANLEQRMEFLKAEINMVGEKYLTVNGFMQCMTTIREVLFGDTDMLAAEGTRADARRLAMKMSALAKSLGARLEDEDVDTIDASFLDGLLDENFVSDEHSTFEIADQLLIIQLLQNIGPSIDDLVEFREGSAAGIVALNEAIENVGKKPKLASV